MVRRAPLAIASGLVLAAGLTAAALRPRPQPLPVFGALPGFALVAQNGSAVSLASLAGQPFVADFIFTRCRGICPGMTARMAQLDKRLPERIGLVSFSVDPEHDTPEVLTRYARDFGAGPRWRFVTGARGALHALATQGFKLAAMELPQDQQATNADGPFLHSSKFVLVDGGGRIRGYYDSAEPGVLERLRVDAERASEGD